MEDQDVEQFLHSLTRAVPLRFVRREGGQVLLLGAKEVPLNLLVELAQKWLDSAPNGVRQADAARTLARAAYKRVWQTPEQHWPPS
ncbi:hypothetical protein [Frigoriglobus tundricola]|uniref:Uncharacterized protein n=1 Tax=Frigoriglobus tundricola TaxID=2774151 RepID=A0A6M5YHR8_9BACT|nr:hypothetical protein [Frigoriglobus tundricola]QJW93597.1 hypothetical protein FTUN_1104 [Frigoriglobus tundricola]